MSALKKLNRLRNIPRNRATRNRRPKNHLVRQNPAVVVIHPNTPTQMIHTHTR